MDKILKIALMLTAIDNMSNVVNSATGKAMDSMKKLKAFAQTEFANGMLMIGAGKQGFEMMKPAVDAFGDMEEAGIRLQNAIMKDGGAFDGKMYQRMYKSAQKLSDGYTGSTEDYLQMMTVLKNNRINPEDILGGIGEATAKLGHLFKMQPAAIGEFAAHMRNDMGVAVKDMQQVMDLTQRVQAVGVGKTGEEAVYEMNQFFSKVGLGLVNLKSQGIESAKAIGSLGAIFMRKGISGESTGTNFRRILDGLRDPTKIDKANEIARKYGQTLEFYDKKGNFAGIENFVAQLDKLKGLDTQAIAEILKPFSGRQGLSTDFLELLAHSGVEEFNQMNKDLFSQGTLSQKERNLSKGLNHNIAIFKSSWRNAIAEVGAAAAPFLTKMFVWLNKVAVAMRNFVHNNPGITRMVLGFISLASAALIVAGSFKVISAAFSIVNVFFKIGAALKWLRIAFAVLSPSLWAATVACWNFTVALLANPITWIVVGIVALGAAIYGVYKHWDKMSRGAKIALLAILPIAVIPTYIIKHWSQISAFFANVWNKIEAVWSTTVIFWKFVWDKAKEVFMSAVVWLIGLGPRMYNAGKNMVMSVYNGIKALAHKPVEAIKNMVGKIRNLLPFSPAKDGPLRDIHKIRLVETIAESIRPDSLIAKMRHVASAVFELRPQQSSVSPLLAGSNGSVTLQLHYAPVYHAAPGDGPPGDGNASFMRWADGNKKQLAKMVADILSDTRKSY